MILTKRKSVIAGPSNGTGEGVAHSKRWYVALVRMHHEKKVAERLDRMGIENFVPVQQEIHQWSDHLTAVTPLVNLLLNRNKIFNPHFIQTFRDFLFVMHANQSYIPTF